MDIQLYDRVLLIDGYQATIVEIFNDKETFIAEIDREDGIYTEDVYISDILCILK